MAHVEGNALLDVSFCGVRGSTPCPATRTAATAATPSCVPLERPATTRSCSTSAPGLRHFGQTQPHRRLVPRHRPSSPTSTGTTCRACRSSRPILAPGARLDVYGPPQEAGSLAEAFDQFVRPPFFPVTVEQLYGHITFHDVDDGDVEIDGAKVRVRPVPHVGATNGYRVEVGGRDVAYISRPPACPSTAATRSPTACSSCATAPTW